MAEVCVWFNPSCSKCRGAREILEERGVEADYRHYLDDAPSVEELRDVLARLGTDDPRAIARTGEARWQELRLDDAGAEEILEAMAANPVLLERPIVISGGRAVVGRPPERVIELL